MAPRTESLSEKAYRKLGAAVREKRLRESEGINQKELASLLEVSECQITYVTYGGKTRNGKETKPSWDAVTRLAKYAELSIDELRKIKDEPLAHEVVLAYCPNQHCVSHRYRAYRGQVYARPQFRRVRPKARERCEACGEILQQHCPSCQEREPVQSSYRCGKCGQRYVEVPRELWGIAPSELPEACERLNFEAQMIYPIRPYNTWLRSADV